MLQSKTQTANVLQIFLKNAETQFKSQVQIIHNDNGTEFVNAACTKLFQEKGMHHQRSCVYTPQQNGTVERKHRHLLDMARALIFQSRMPSKYWGEAIMMATTIINVLPTRVLDWKSPHQVLYGEDPNYNKFKTFGCCCYYTNVTPHKDKFSPREKAAIHIGFSVGQKGWKLLDIESGKIITSRDVQFEEDLFPFEDTSFTIPSNFGISHQLTENQLKSGTNSNIPMMTRSKREV